jgi:hypothetical protein
LAGGIQGFGAGGKLIGHVEVVPARGYGNGVLQPSNMPEPRGPRPSERWWEPYLGVLLGAVAAAALLIVFLLLNAGEIGRVLRASGL